MNPLAGGRLARLFPQAAVAGASAAEAPAAHRWLAPKIRCETCATRRSHTNIAVCLLLLGAFLSYNWYDFLVRNAAQDAPGLAAIVAIQNERRPEPSPAVEPAPPVVARPEPTVATAAAEPLRPERPAPRRIRNRPAAEPAPPPAEMDGLY